ncbi:MAG: tetratricopeptide repeat protein [Nitrospiraceae bacterium]|nr:MAG: tetratricopeptide repeat protein [Nitrospiraceae bacterium]
MKNFTKIIMSAALVCLCIVCTGNTSYGQIHIGQKAPDFSLKDMNGTVHALSDLSNKSLLMLYFFDADSRPSQEGLLNLYHLSEKYDKADLTVLAITLSERNEISKFIKNSGITSPILIDDAYVSISYNAEIILPTVCILGPDLQVLDYFQGGGKTTEAMLVRVAERELQRKNTMLAKAISSDIVNKNPDNVKAKTVKAYAALQEGNVDEAEQSFNDLSGQGKNGRILGKEGLAAVYAKKNQPEKALQMVKEVKEEAPERSYVHLIEGDILYAQKKEKEAEEAYIRAVNAKEAEPYHEAARYNQRGRMYADAGQYEKARELYDKAVSIDPFYITGTTNKGLTYEKEGNLDMALESYKKALSIDQNDTFAAVLAKKAQELINLQNNGDRKKRMDSLVHDLAERFRTQQTDQKKKQDEWTSPPMILSFIDFHEKGGLSERDGFAAVLSTQLTDYLNASGRVKVVERALMESLLEELNLGSSDLADTETALKLGKVLAAKIIVTGSIYYLPQKTLLSLRLIDTETSSIPQVTTWQISDGSLDKEMFNLNREILKTVILKYPLKGYIVTTAGDQFIINLGANQGVVTGTKFDVIEELEPIEYKGRILNGSPKTIGSFEVITVEPDMSTVRVIKTDRPLKADDKIMEKIEQAAL